MNAERLTNLVRLRLLVRGKQSPARIADGLARYAGDVPPERWREEWNAALDRLDAAGELDRSSLSLTELGRERALRSIGLTQLPARASWKSIVRDHLVPAALGVGEPSKKRLRDADGLRAAILGGVSEGSPRRLSQVLDAMVWRALGMEADTPLTLTKLRERVLARELGQERPMPLARAVRLAAAKAAGARRTETDALAEAVVGRWMAAAGEAPPIERFAREVLRVAREPETRRFTDEKAFIDSVWERLDASDGRPDLTRFKELLLEAHRRGLVVLSRADLTQLIEPRELAASEVLSHGAAFHFIRTDLPEARP